ncbi:efflux RND transporter periplasmic adaptor subunit [Isobaculum melis]|uniref:HlyD family secretion protein n=1 Tax=Isobaculum melis TaxID=142588 RepID=A0A1H9SUD4_9LACT|nr:HlyD family efflux transporter periplasmic adaptor subunit [Isobaculum melis]SER87949.1 HlyD family secretion protein [Isobaculum melis]
MNIKKILGIVVALAIVAFIGFNVFGNQKPETIDTVKTGTVTEENISEVLSLTGTLVPNETKDVYGQGIVNEVKFSVGDAVNQDDVVLTYKDGTEIKAPFNGKIIALNVKNDEVDTGAQSGKPAVSFANLETLKVEVNLSKSEASKIKKDQVVVLTNAGEKYAGHVTEVNPVAVTSQSATGSVTALPAVISFDQAPTDLIAGFTIDATVTTNTVENVLAIPVEAILYDKDNQPYVYIASENKDKKAVAKKVTIETGLQSDTKIEVKTGLEKGQKVVLSPDEKLSDGALIKEK